MEEVIQFEEFAKIPRLRRECVVTEKLDGTNGQILVVEDSNHHLSIQGSGAIVPVEFDEFCVAVVETDKYRRGIYAGSRNRWLKSGKTTDNFGFAAWVKENADQLAQLGPGRHYGEWWGQGIQRTYGLDHKRFSLFNVARWRDENSPDGLITAHYPMAMEVPKCCGVVPVLNICTFTTSNVQNWIDMLMEFGSFAAPGFMNPEGIVVYHTAGNVLFKQTIEKDEEPKSKVA